MTSPFNKDQPDGNISNAAGDASLEQIEFTIGQEDEQVFEECLQESKLMLVGGDLNTARMANFIYSLFNRYGFQVLALQWPAEWKNALDKYFKYGDLEIKRIGQPKVNSAMLTLLKTFHERHLAELVLIDSSASFDHWTSRDKHMAEKVLEVCSKGRRVLVAAEPLSALTHEVDSMGVEGKPMGAILRESIPRLLPCTVKP